MTPNLLITYNEGEENYSIPIGALAESLDGFDKIIAEIAELSGYEGEIDVAVTRLEPGSLQVLLTLIATHTALPFADVNGLIDFLKVASPDLFHEVVRDVGTGHRTLNDYFSNNPLDQEVVSNLISTFVGYLFGASGKLKENIGTQEMGADMPVRYRRPLRKMIHDGKFKKALQPIADNTADKITVSTPTVKPVHVSGENLGDYLEEQEKILPAFIDGEHIRLVCEVVSLQSTRGERIGLRMAESPGLVLVAYPPVDETTDNYLGMYKKNVIVEAYIMRKSMFQKPQLKILSLEVQQPTLME